MVYYFTSNVVSPPYNLYVGIDKNENEDLIRWGWPEDVWFHVDKLSSAHVYLRLHEGQSLDDIPTSVIEDCAQLVKANSIMGNKANNIDVVYTMWANLQKTGNMDAGQVGFHKQKQVRKIHVERRVNEIVNRLNKTKIEKPQDADERRLEREGRDKREREDQKAVQRDLKKQEKEALDKKAKDAEARSYSNLMSAENMTSNQDAGYDSDDFM